MSVLYMKINGFVCTKHSPKNLWTQLEPKKLHPSLKIDFLAKNIFLIQGAHKAHMAK
eukprot:UN18923